MSDCLSYGGFKWLKSVDNFDANSIGEKSPIGHILKVDLEYLNQLHVLHNDYLLDPKELAIPYDMLSDYCKKIADKYEIDVGDMTKLIPNLDNKTNYELHYKNLVFVFRNEITKTHRVVKFKQSDWIKKYIHFNTEKEQMLLIVLKKTFLS